jgi:outer membrane protein
MIRILGPRARTRRIDVTAAVSCWLVAAFALVSAAWGDRAPAAETPAASVPKAAVPGKLPPRSRAPAANAAEPRSTAVPPAGKPTPAPEDIGEAETPAPADPSATALSLARAMELAMQTSLPAAVARVRVDEADANARIARSALLPALGLAVGQSNQTVNLKAQGIQLPGMPPLIGPFNSFDARIRLSQSVFNAAALRSHDASLAAIDAAQAQERAVRQQLAASTALGYVEALRSARTVDAARANLKLARSLLDLARDQRNAGVATGVDVARAESSVAQLEVALAQARTGAEQAQLQLRRITGLSLGTPLALSDPLRYQADPPPPLAAAIAYALEHREEPHALGNVLRQRQLEVSATRAERYPSVDLTADVGASGSTPTKDEYGTRNIGMRLSVPLFSGGLIDARIDAAASRAREAELQLRDTSRQVEEDVRLAVTTLQTAEEQVRSAEVALELTLRLLRLARDRFASGVADNLEVLDAQTSLVNARYNRVAALGTWNVARINLAGALGRAEDFRF